MPVCWDDDFDPMMDIERRTCSESVHEIEQKPISPHYKNNNSVTRQKEAGGVVWHDCSTGDSTHDACCGCRGIVGL